MEPEVAPPTPLELDMIADALLISAEMLGDESPKFAALASASPGNLIDSLASASVWLSAWAALVDEARSRLLASAFTRHRMTHACEPLNITKE